MIVRRLARQLRSALTGKTYCSLTSRHGHDFELVGRMFPDRETRTLIYQCSGCGTIASMDRWSMGLEIRPEGLPESGMEPISGPKTP
ncbi:MAG: hypothetical protein AWU57_481 [Marinobacter sp. T13-3]|nr:MAG: hypothetical protein AWU57_481 [Marinobacter sp. T13-3]